LRQRNRGRREPSRQIRNALRNIAKGNLRKEREIRSRGKDEKRDASRMEEPKAGGGNREEGENVHQRPFINSSDSYTMCHCGREYRTRRKDGMGHCHRINRGLLSEMQVGEIKKTTSVASAL